MIPIFLYLAGMSFVIAIAAICMGVAERKRSRKVEQEFQKSLQLLNHGQEHNAVMIVRLADQDAALLDLIKALAPTLAEPSRPQGILVPGPRRLQ